MAFSFLVINYYIFQLLFLSKGEKCCSANLQPEHTNLHWLNLVPLQTFLKSFLRVRLHWVPVSTQSQCCDDACDLALIEINRNKSSCSWMGLQPILEQLHSFPYQPCCKRHRSIDCADADASCKRILRTFWSKFFEGFTDCTTEKGAHLFACKNDLYSSWNVVSCSDLMLCCMEKCSWKTWKTCSRKSLYETRDVLD